MTWEEFFMLIQTILSGVVKKKEQPAVLQTNFCPRQNCGHTFRLQKFGGEKIPAQPWRFQQKKPWRWATAFTARRYYDGNKPVEADLCDLAVQAHGVVAANFHGRIEGGLFHGNADPITKPAGRNRRRAPQHNLLLGINLDCFNGDDVAPKFAVPAASSRRKRQHHGKPNWTGWHLNDQKIFAVHHNRPLPFLGRAELSEIR